METKNILIVDDDELIYNVIKRVLKNRQDSEKTELSFHYASNVDDAIQTLSNKNIDMVFTDYMIQGFNQTGEDVINWINSKNLDTKVVVTTSIKDVDLHKKLISMGACTVMRKPFNPKSLISNYKNYIKG